jgi:uncharacterized protein with PIN domain
MNSPLKDLRNAGFDIESVNHAEAILYHDIRDALTDLYHILLDFQIDVSELIKGGGGESSITQRLRRRFEERGWHGHQFLVERRVDGYERASFSHHVDHVKRFDSNTVACEIEWNNKDPFFDRDLETFRRLHEEGAISVGIIITRGQSLQENLVRKVSRFAHDNKINSCKDLDACGVKLTQRQKDQIVDRLKSEKRTFAETWAQVFVSDKFGKATTHWAKLEERIRRGLGNPCPLVLIGLPCSTVKGVKYGRGCR